MNHLFLAYVLHLNYSHKIYLQVIINAIVPDFIEVNNNKEQKNYVLTSVMHQTQNQNHFLLFDPHNTTNCTVFVVLSLY